MDLLSLQRIFCLILLYNEHFQAQEIASTKYKCFYINDTINIQSTYLISMPRRSARGVMGLKTPRA